jgi:hypothetical protein
MFLAKTADPFRKIEVSSVELDYELEHEKREPTSTLMLHKDYQPWTVFTFDLDKIQRFATENKDKPVTPKEFILAMKKQALSRFKNGSIRFVAEPDLIPTLKELIDEGELDLTVNTVKPTVIDHQITRITPDLAFKIDDDKVKGMADLELKLKEAQQKAEAEAEAAAEARAELAALQASTKETVKK